MNDHYHVDDLSIDQVPRRYWYKLAFEALNLSKSYIARKQYNMFCHMNFHVKIKDMDNVKGLRDIQYTYEPFSIYLWKEYPRDVFNLLKYSKRLSDIYGMGVYITR